MNTSVEALILVIQTDEFLRTGVPVDLIDKISIVNRDLVDIQNQAHLRFRAMMALLNLYLVKQ